MTEFPPLHYQAMFLYKFVYYTGKRKCTVTGTVYWYRTLLQLYKRVPKRSEKPLIWRMFHVWYVVSVNRINAPILRTSRNSTAMKNGKHGGNKIHIASAFKTPSTPRLTCVYSALLPWLCMHKEDLSSECTLMTAANLYKAEVAIRSLVSVSPIWRHISALRVHKERFH